VQLNLHGKFHLGDHWGDRLYNWGPPSLELPL